MSRSIYQWCAALLLLASAFAQPAKPTDATIRQWFSSSDRRDFAARVRFLKPLLTYQQRYLVEVRVAIDGNVARGRNLDAFLAVADSSNHLLWESLLKKDVETANMKRNAELQLVAGFYAPPGQYRAALVLYDKSSRQLFVHHEAVNVVRIKNDPLPDYGGRGARIEFTLPPDQGSHLRSIDQDTTLIAESYWPLASDREDLPVESPRPIMLDLVVDFTGSGDENSAPENANLNLNRLTAMASALMDLQAPQLCVRISGFDLPQMETIYLRKDPKDLNWDDVRKARAAAGSRVSVAALKSRKDQPVFFRDFFLKLSQPAHCEAHDAMHVIAVVTSGEGFPSGAHRASVPREAFENARIFYFRTVGALQLRRDYRGNPYILGTNQDDLPSALNELGAHRFTIESPTDFRRALAHMLENLQREKND